MNKNPYDAMFEFFKKKCMKQVIKWKKKGYKSLTSA